jgi:hypothetical protein
MSLRPRCEEPSVCTELEQRPVQPLSPRGNLTSIIRTATALVRLCWWVLAPIPTCAQTVYGSIFGTVTWLPAIFVQLVTH